jgi:putative tricarboxylic transport membrane protein
VELINSLLGGFATALTPANLLYAGIGVLLGTAIGVLPGIGPALTISLLLPLTFKLDPVGAFIMFGGIYYGAMYGGSTTSILVNAPGESASVVTALDGYQMAKKGRAGAALATSAIGSFVAGTLATIGLMVFATILVEQAVKLGPPELFAIMIVALSAVTSLSGTSVPKSVFATLLGLGLGLIGLDNQTGQLRLTYGINELEEGIDVVLGAIGLFALSEVFWYAATLRSQDEHRETIKGPVWMTRNEFRRSVPSWLRGSGIGFFIGALPGAGATIASFISYAIEKRVSKHKAEFGKGAIEGAAGPEAANNAAAGGHLVPLLGLGIPGSGTTAVMLAAFQIYGLQPGPLLFNTRPDLVWGLIASLYIANVMLLVLNLPLVGIWVKLLDIPKPLLFAGITVISAIGVYSLNRNAFDLVVVFVLGVIGLRLSARSGDPGHRARSAHRQQPSTRNDPDRRKHRRDADPPGYGGHPRDRHRLPRASLRPPPLRSGSGPHRSGDAHRDGGRLDLDQAPVGRVLDLELRKMRESLGPKVREHDPLRFELLSVRHHLGIRDVRRVVAVEERRLADKEVGPLGDGDEVLGEAGVAGVCDELSRDLNPQAVGLRKPNVTHGQRGHARAAELRRLGAEHDRAQWKSECGRPEEVWKERLLLRAEALVQRWWPSDNEGLLATGEMLLEYEESDAAEVVAVKMRDRDGVDRRRVDVLLDRG